MRFDKLERNDPRVVWAKAPVRGKTYHYMRADPDDGPPLAIIFLLHGFPDLAFGWRCRILFLKSSAYQVIAPDMLGFGKTSAYALRSAAEDIKELAKSIVKDKKIILGGIFSIGTPFTPPSSTFRSLDDAPQSKRPKNQRYQLQFRGTALEEEIKDREQVGQFLNAMFGGVGAGGQAGFDPARGVLFKNLPQLRPPPFLSGNELDYYVSQYFRDGQPSLKQALNWYRTGAHNYLDELRLLPKPIKFSMPTLFVAATRDEAISGVMLEGMDQYFEDLTCAEVEGSRSALWESPEDRRENCRMAGKEERSIRCTNHFILFPQLDDAEKSKVVHWPSSYPP
ncbi:hypothetical protein CEP54_015415 [Fusarium duplospermum]|uniref:AB hydrolase-1 domain-containing protein n=1 Tax=Fusarium duplospermum TaxID=1325734 RepID=A0A428NPD0_9HYPO|nr:hypothetical protein CEP54_015415 [Fusarium duplospermum]